MSIDWNTAFAPRALKLTASEIRELLKLINQPDIISFAGGIPDPALFPHAILAETFHEILSNPETRNAALQYSVSEGYQPLREWLAQTYLPKIGIATHADNILITNGSQQGLEFLAKLFIGTGDRIIVTNPSYLGALQAFSLYEPTFVTVPVQEDGVDLAGLEAEMAKGAKFFYLTPDFGNPCGATVSLAQRRAMLDLAYRYGIAIIEDSAYDQLRYDGEPVPPLLALDSDRLNQPRPLSEATAQGQVIYTGTFSKSIVPALRIGWIVAPQPVLQKLVLMKQASDLHTPTLNQMAMYKVAHRIIFDHAASIRSVYRERRDAMLTALTEFMPDGVTWTRPEGGMFVWVTLPEGLDAADLLAKSISTIRVAFVPGAAFYPDRSGKNTIRLSFSVPPPETVREGIRRLGGLITEAVAACKVGA